MSNVHTGELLNFQDYSPEHNERTARIDVEAVHANQYNNSNISNQNYSFDETPGAVPEAETQPQCKNFFFFSRNRNLRS